MSKLKSFEKVVVRPCDHTEQEYLDYCNLLEKAGVLWKAGEKPTEFNFPPELDMAVILEPYTMTLCMGALGNPDPDRYNTTIQYAMFLLEDHLHEQAYFFGQIPDID